MRGSTLAVRRAAAYARTTHSGRATGSPAHPRRRPAPRPPSAVPPPGARGPDSAASSSTGSAVPPDLATLLEGGPSAASAVRPDYCAILVLGGGLAPDGHLPPWVAHRLDAAVAIQRVQADPRTPIAILGAGTPHKAPPHDPRSGRELWECTAGARYLRDRHGLDLSGGVGGRVAHPPTPALLPPVLKEAASFDTVGNALFALTTHALPAGWSRLAVVTSSWHAARAAAIFDRVFGLANRAFRARDGPGFEGPPPFSLAYHATADDRSFPPDVLAARAGREAASRAAWNDATAGFSTLAELHAWVHATHLCYAAARQDEFGVPAAVNAGVDPKALASY